MKQYVPMNFYEHVWRGTPIFITPFVEMSEDGQNLLDVYKDVV